MAGEDWSLSGIGEAVWRGVSSIIEMARTNSTSETTNTKVIQRKLRVRVLDCRTGTGLKQMPVKDVKIDGQAAVRYDWAADDWDLSTRVAMCDGSGTTLWAGVRSQQALKAMGYNVGGEPTATYGPTGRKAFQEFQVDLIYPPGFVGPQQPREELNLLETPNDAWRKRIVDEYNKRVFSAAQRHLIALGFLKGDEVPDPGVWNARSKEAFKKWQKVELGSKQAAQQSYPNREKEGKALHEARRHFYTNNNGDVFIPIPIETLRSDKYTLEIGFTDFPVLAEALESERSKASGIIHRHVRPDGMPGQRQVTTPYGDVAPGTGFSVEWVQRAQQAGSDQPWGWRLGAAPAATDADRSAMAEFRTSWVFKDIPGFGKDGEIDFKALHTKKKCFSMFYQVGDDDPQQYMPEFVLFALQWCQPVWEAHPANASWIGGDYTSNAATERIPASMRFVMSAATGYRGREQIDEPNNASLTPAIGGGREYGRFIPNPTTAVYTRWNSGAPRKHTGFDIWGVDGQTPIFAIHGGKSAQTYLSNGGYGNSIVYEFKHADKAWYIRYAHLSGTPTVATNGTFMTGQRLGTMGQTFNGNSPHGYPIHLHLEFSPRQTTQGTPRIPWSELAGDVDIVNLKTCFPDNGVHHKFPCDCPSTNYAAQTCRLRGGNSDLIASRCWASRQLRCPYLVAGTRRIQAQLVFMHEDGGNPYTRPGTVHNQIDGNWSANHQASIRVFREQNRAAIADLPNPPDPLPPNATPQQVQQHQQATQQYNAAMQAEPAAGSGTLRVLNALAPYPRP
ncbi:MAG: M23 family metallopeptidase [Phycisphaeraceae bacterium]|nr:M23 family metallopeptidase [Phycisphaeraceae bacterium]